MIGRRVSTTATGALITLLSSLPADGQTVQSLAGTYCLSDVREVGSCFRLSADQRFEYFLSYGAYDETSEGRWRIDGGEVVIESLPYDRKPTFVFKERRAAESEGFKIVVVNATGRGIPGVDVRVNCGGAVYESYTQQDGYETPCAAAPSEISFAIRMIGLAHQTAPFSATSGTDKALVFTFDPGDLGKKALLGVRLRRESNGLSMDYRSLAVRDLADRSNDDQRAGRYYRQAPGQSG